MWISKLKKKKLQSFLLGIIFIVAISLICVSTVVTVVSQTFATKYYEGDRTPDLQVYTTSDSVAEKTRSWYESKKNELRNYQQNEVFSLSTNLVFSDEINDSALGYVVPMEQIGTLCNKLDIVEGSKEQTAPKRGEMWVSTTTANAKEIEIGDTAKIMNPDGSVLEYEVSAIVSDSNQCSTAIGVIYVYINESEREELRNLPRAHMITMNCNGDTSAMSSELVEYINEPLAGVAVDKSLYIASAMLNTSLLGGLGMMASIVLIIILILIVRANLKNQVLKEYKSIGIYKAMGYTSKKIRSIYFMEYGVISVVSSFLGFVISIPMIQALCNIAFKNLGEYHFDVTSVAIMIIVFLAFNLLVGYNLYRVLRCIDKIKPVEAIQIGLASSKEKMKKSVLPDQSSSIGMAINDIFKYKKNNAITLVMFILVFYLSTFFFNLYYSMQSLDDNLYKIFGTANADLVVSAPLDYEDSLNEIETYLQGDTRIKKYYSWDTVAQSKVGIDTNKYVVKSGFFAATVYNEFNETDYTITKGFNPRNNKETAISTAMMKQNKFQIGDYIKLNIEGNKKQFLIVGYYPSMNSNGQSVRITRDALSGTSSGNVAFLKLQDVKDKESLKQELEEKFQGIKVDEVYSALKVSASQVVEMMVPISVILLVGVLLFGTFNIINILLSNHMDQRKTYGIMKSLGFSNGYIKRRSNARLGILAILGALIGVGIMFVTSKALMVAILEFDVLKFHMGMTFGLVGITFAVIMFTMHMCNTTIDKISTVELIKE